MGKFIFTYEKILRIKIELENEVKNKLAVEIQKKVKLNTKLIKIIESQKEYLIFINDRISGGIKASDLKRFNAEKMYFRREIIELQKNIKKQEMKIIERRQELSKALQETKKFEKIKEKQFEKYVEEMYASERKAVEEIVNYKNYKLSGDKNGR